MDCEEYLCRFLTENVFHTTVDWFICFPYLRINMRAEQVMYLKDRNACGVWIRKEMEKKWEWKRKRWRGKGGGKMWKKEGNKRAFNILWGHCVNWQLLVLRQRYLTWGPCLSLGSLRSSLQSTEVFDYICAVHFNVQYVHNLYLEQLPSDRSKVLEKAYMN